MKVRWTEKKKKNWQTCSIQIGGVLLRDSVREASYFLTLPLPPLNLKASNAHCGHVQVLSRRGTFFKDDTLCAQTSTRGIRQKDYLFI